MSSSPLDRSNRPDISSDIEQLFTAASQVLKAAEKCWPRPLGGFGPNSLEERMRSEVTGHAIDWLVQDWKSRSGNRRRKPPEQAT